jgi:NitT/TauT family transport system permease protein
MADAAAHAARARRSALGAALPWIGAAAALLAWQAAVAASGTTVFPAPAAVARGIAELARRGVLAAYIGDSLLRVGSGYLIGLALGIPFGCALGSSRAFALAANPVVQLLRPISPLAWIPVAIVLFGVSNAAPIFLVSLATFFTVAVATANGVASVPEIYRRAASNFGLSRPALFARVLLPAALPQMLVGLRIALGVAWLVIVAAEMIAVDSGLGYLVIDARNAGKRYDLVVAAMLLIGLIGLVLDALVRRLERLRSVAWGFRAEA